MVIGWYSWGAAAQGGGERGLGWRTRNFTRQENQADCPNGKSDGNQDGRAVAPKSSKRGSNAGWSAGCKRLKRQWPAGVRASCGTNNGKRRPLRQQKERKECDDDVWFHRTRSMQIPRLSFFRIRFTGRKKLRSVPFEGLLRPMTQHSLGREGGFVSGPTGVAHP